MTIDLFVYHGCLLVEGLCYFSFYCDYCCIVSGFVMHMYRISKRVLIFYKQKGHWQFVNILQQLRIHVCLQSHFWIRCTTPKARKGDIDRLWYTYQLAPTSRIGGRIVAGLFICSFSVIVNSSLDMSKVSIVVSNVTRMAIEFLSA